MKNARLIITRHGHEVEVEITPDNPGLGDVLEDTAEYDESTGNKIGLLYAEDDGIPLTILEEDEARDRLAEASGEPEDDFCEEPDVEPLTNRQQDAAADAYFGDRL